MKSRTAAWTPFVPVAAAATLLLSGCFSMKPMILNTRAENLGIAESAKIPLNVAVVVPDPMEFRIIFTHNIGPGYRGDKTPGRNRDALYPITRELVKLSADTFSQVFRKATVLRELPPPGEYDAVIQVYVKEMNMHQTVARAMGGQEFELSNKWEMSVLNGESVEILSHKDSSAPMKLTVKYYPSSEALAGPAAEGLVMMVKDWGMRLSASREIKALAKVKRG